MVLKKLMLARGTVLTIIGTLLAAAVASCLVPQAFLTPPDKVAAWRSSHRAVLPLIDLLGLHSVYSSPWFAMGTMLLLVSLAWSTLDQLSAARARTWRGKAPDLSGAHAVGTNAQALHHAVHRFGYRLLPCDRGMRFVKHPWGYWGNFLLHLGMALTIAASLSIALTQQRGMRVLLEGDTATPGELWTSRESGMLVPPLELDEAVRFDRLRIGVSPRMNVERVASDLTFTSADGRSRTRSVEINGIISDHGFHLYQSSEYGDSFTVEFITPSGVRHVEELQIPYPAKMDGAGYKDFTFPWLGPTLSTKYFTDEDTRPREGERKLLVMRLLDGGTERERLSLKTGESGMLGGYGVKLVGSRKFSGVIFVRTPGISFVFLGFFIMIVGGLLNYGFPPRELFALEEGNQWRICWRAQKFGVFYEEEFAALLKELEQTGRQR